MRGRRNEESSGINSSCPNIYEVLPEGWGHADLGSFGRLDKDTTGLFLMG
jgi:16S rRNA U516 pseudouridylate synthase RsuA-like enzyme